MERLSRLLITGILNLPRAPAGQGGGPVNLSQLGYITTTPILGAARLPRRPDAPEVAPPTPVKAAAPSGWAS